MTDVIVIETALPDPCLNPNARPHWSKKSRAKKELRSRVANTVRILYPEFVDAGWEGAEIKYDFYHKLRRGRDDDNYSAMMKSGRDAFGPDKFTNGRRGRKIHHIGTGVVTDDNVIREVQDPGMHIDENERVVITLTRTQGDQQ